MDKIIIGEKLDNGKEDLYKIKFILKTGEMIKDNLPNNKLKIGSDMGHYGFSINKQSLERSYPLTCLALWKQKVKSKIIIF